MIWIIIKKEILENLTTYRFLLLTGLLTLLIIVSIIVTYGDFQVRLENYNVLRPEKSSANVIISPNPLSIFVRGLDANLGRLYEISALGIEVHSSQQSINRLFSLFTVPDMLFIIKVVLALVALLFAGDAICGEKESGTLKLALANGGSRIAILLGKLCGRFLLTFVPFFTLFLIAVIVVSLLPDVQTDSIFWTRVSIIGLAACIYSLVFTALGIFVSSIVARSSTSMIVCLAVWVLLVFIIPNMGVTIAKTVADVPPSDRVEMERRLGTIQAIFKRVQHDADDRAGARMVQEIKESNSHMFETYRPKFNNLIDITKTITRISPTGSLTYLVTDVTSTGLLEEKHLKDAISQHVARNFDQIVEPEKGEVIPFIYTNKPLVDVFTESAFVDFGILIIVAVSFIVFAMIKFYRYDVR